MHQFHMDPKPEWKHFSYEEIGECVIQYVQEWFGIKDAYSQLTREQDDQLLAFVYKIEVDERYDSAIGANLIALHEHTYFRLKREYKEKH